MRREPTPRIRGRRHKQGPRAPKKRREPRHNTRRHDVELDARPSDPLLSQREDSKKNPSQRSADLIHDLNLPSEAVEDARRIGYDLRDRLRYNSRKRIDAVLCYFASVLPPLAPAGIVEPNRALAAFQEAVYPSFAAVEQQVASGL